jgi:TatD DNase family protein
MLVDTHAHLSFPQFESDLEAVIANASEAGVLRIVNVGTDLEMSRRAVSLADRHEDVYATAGFHPHDVERATPVGLTALAELLDHAKVVAVGETGLDFYRDYAPRALQEEVFRHQIALARDRGLPLVVHSRGAEARVAEILEAEGASEVGGVLHCFGGGLEEARMGLALGFHLGFGGTVTFKNSTSLGLALEMPAERVLLETDCPYLAPDPHRGWRNEPAYLAFVARRLAAAKGEVLERLGERTSRNAHRLFGLPD